MVVVYANRSSTWPYPNQTLNSRFQPPVQELGVSFLLHFDLVVGNKQALLEDYALALSKGVSFDKAEMISQTALRIAG